MSKRRKFHLVTERLLPIVIGKSRYLNKNLCSRHEISYQENEEEKSKALASYFIIWHKKITAQLIERTIFFRNLCSLLAHPLYICFLVLKENSSIYINSILSSSCII